MNQNHTTLITEEGKELQHEEETKEHVADYYENLYQPRPCKEEYKHKTEEIEAKVKQIEIEMTNFYFSFI